MNWQESRRNCVLGLATWHKLRCLAEVESNNPLPNESENTLSLVSELSPKHQIQLIEVTDIKHVLKGK